MSDDATSTQPVEPIPEVEGLRPLVQEIVLAIVGDLEKRIQAERSDFERRLLHLVGAFKDEMRGHVARLAEESTVGHAEMIASNNSAVHELRSLRTHVDAIVAQGTRDRNQFDRNAESVALQMRALRDALAELRDAKREHKTATRELTQELRTAKRRRTTGRRRKER